MEIRAILNKPYTEKQKMEFIVEYNHKQGLPIVETETELQALCYTVTELEKREQQRIAMLSLTAADVERGIYKATGMDFDDIIAKVQSLCDSSAEPQNDVLNIDIKALKIELKANNFYRGNPYVDAVGNLLGFSKEQLDEFFETNDYTKLLN
ncbi:MAG: hypothetical protein IJ301_04290 [Clostridia bacterium]|nr:hypothetical protein [Clostridia bacterium]